MKNDWKQNVLTGETEQVYRPVSDHLETIVNEQQMHVPWSVASGCFRSLPVAMKSVAKDQFNQAYELVCDTWRLVAMEYMCKFHNQLQVVARGFWQLLQWNQQILTCLQTLANYSLRGTESEWKVWSNASFEMFRLQWWGRQWSPPTTFSNFQQPLANLTGNTYFFFATAGSY